MAAVTRWTEFPVAGATYVKSSYAKGYRGYKDSTLLTTEDDFTITSANNKLYLNLDGAGSFNITLASGTELDPRFVAKDITEKIHLTTASHPNAALDRYQFSQCEWGCLPGSSKNGFRLFSGTIGSSSAVTVSSGSNTAHGTLGFDVGAGTGGSNNSFASGGYTFNGSVGISGTWYGFWDETYQIMIGETEGAAPAAQANGITSSTQGGSNKYPGTMTTGGFYSSTVETGDTYIITIDTTNGTTVGAGAGAVPRYKVSGHSTDNNPSSEVDILFADYWYPVGTRGVKVKWSDAVFDDVAVGWTIVVEAPKYAAGTDTTAPPGQAKYTWSSNRGDDWMITDGANPILTASGGYTELGTRGLYVTFSGSNSLAPREVYAVQCRAPQPSAYAITQLNYGNVTVSTESPVKTVAFEIMSGAYEISSVKFGLQADGTFSHHDAGDSDTYFRFGTVGPTNNATDPVSSKTGTEWWPNVAAADIDSDVPPVYLYATEDDLAVVASADLSEDLGSQQTYLQSDPLWLGIRLGANETGANSTINYRLYFDYS
jgi:hypothetical protein